LKHLDATWNKGPQAISLADMADDFLDPDIAARLLAHTPLGHSRTPEDVAGTSTW